MKRLFVSLGLDVGDFTSPSFGKTCRGGREHGNWVHGGGAAAPSLMQRLRR